MSRLRAITFDVTHTLIHCPRAAEIYSEVLRRHDVPVAAAEVARWIPVVWQELACRVRANRDRFVSHPQGARGFWADYLLRLCQYLEAPAPSRFAAAELYQRFARADAWEIYPEVPRTLERLRRMGLALAVVSNWDERLGPLLTRLELTRYFDAVVPSCRVGVEKPDPRIFHYTLELLGVPAAEALHVGDSAREDVEGAVAAGMRAAHLVRPGGRDDGGTRATDLPDLSPLPGRVGTAGWLRVPPPDVLG